MNLTLGEAKEDLKDVAGISGMDLLDPNLVKVINRAIGELMKSADYAELVDRYFFKMHDGFLVMPHFLEKPTHITVNKVPMEMRSPWFEFSQHGPGILEPENLGRIVLDRGRIPTFRNIPNTGGPWKLKITAEVDESVDGVEPIFHLRGYDENDKEIYSTGSDALWGRGEDVTISKAAGFSSMTSFNYLNLTSINKPITKGRIFLDATDGVTEIRIAEYAPEERSPSNQVFLIPGVGDCELETNSIGLANEIDVLIRAKKAFVKAINDNDVLAISNIDAIETMIIAQQKRKNQKVTDYLGMKQVSRVLMAEDTNHTEQRSKKPFLTFAKRAGFDYPNIR